MIASLALVFCPLFPESALAIEVGDVIALQRGEQFVTFA